MEELTYLIKGIIIGFAIAAPIGPIGILCIRRSLTESHLSGFITGMGAATADAVYGFIAAFGLTLISNFLIDHKLWLQTIGVIFMAYIGYKIFHDKPQTNKKLKNGDTSLWNHYLSAFIITITNPMTIMGFIFIFAGLGIVQTAGNYTAATLVVIGVFLGSGLWWLILSTFAGFFRKRLNEKGLTTINKITGMAIIIFSVLLLISVIKEFF